MNNEHAITLPPTAELMRQATDVAGVCREIVTKTAMEIQGRKFVRVEGWTSIATAHGCVASARDVERVEGGFRAIGEVKRISDGQVLSQAEGFVGEDEATWFGGVIETRNGQKKLPKRPDYAIRAMCQTRAISRACRTAFSHVVVLMDAGLQTTPAEEVPEGGFDNHAEQAPQSTPTAKSVAQNALRNVTPAAPASPAGALHVEHHEETTRLDNPGSWRSVVVPPFIKRHAGKTLGDMPDKDLKWWAENYEPKPYNGKMQQRDLDLKAALMEGLRSLTPGASAPARNTGPTDDELANVSQETPEEVEF